MINNALAKRMAQYRQVMRFQDCTNYVYLNRISEIRFRKISKYKNAKEIFSKIYNDLCFVNELLKKQDIINSATILRTTYENIIYIIATSYDLNLKVGLDNPPWQFRDVLEKHCDEIFSENIDKELFNDIYRFLCKIVHPCSLKECVTYIDNNRIYKKYVLNNIKYAMLMIEYIYLDFYNKKLNIVDELCDSLSDVLDYVYFFNLIQFSKLVKKDKNIVKKYFLNDSSNPYVREQQKSIIELSEYLKNHPKEFDERKIETLKRADEMINKSEFKDEFFKMLNDYK